MEDKTNQPPRHYQTFLDKYPEVASQYEALGKSIHDNGPLTDRERALVKMAVSGSHLYHSAFKSHIRKAILAGVSREDMEHVALLMLPTVGFPTMMAMLRMIDEQLNER